MLLSQHVESYRFWEIVAQWATEKLQHEHVIARVLAKAVLRDGLRFQSVDPRWAKVGTFELRGAPLVGYVAREGALPVFLRAVALTHIRSIVERAATPQPELLSEEFLTKQDFQAWLERMELTLPAFWFEAGLRHEGAQR